MTSAWTTLRCTAGRATLEIGQRLDHLGFIVDDMEEVDRWYTWLAQAGVTFRRSRKRTATARAASIAKIPPATSSSSYSTHRSPRAASAEPRPG